MKDSNEMARSVLAQAEKRAAKRRHQRRMATGLIAATLCLAILIAVVGVGGHPADGTQPTISVENPNPRPENLNAYSGEVYFLGAVETGETLEPMQVNMTIPACSMIRVRSLKGMTKSEVNKVIAEENAYKASFRQKYRNSDGDRSQIQVLSNYVPWWDQSEYYAVVQHLFAGKPSLILPNASEIKSVDTETTGVLDTSGGYGIYNQDVTLGEGEYAVTIPKGSLRLYLFPAMSNETMYETFKKNPDTPLSTLRDTITVTVNYKNGTKEIIRIDVTVDDDGYIYMTRWGTEEL